jgi:hydrogenase/urease accessory protein HupE
MRLTVNLIAGFFAFLTVTVFVTPAFSDEARPVYVEIAQQAETEYLLKWKIPPVMPAGQEPAVELRHQGCGLSDGSVGGRPAGLVGKKRYSCSQPNPTFSIELIYPRSNPALTSLIVYKPLDGEPLQIFSGPEKTLVELPLASSASAVAKQYTVAGIEHILIGTDHLLFVLCLMMIAGTFKRLVLTVTGFTLAHSVTLSLATLDIFRLPTELVELLIALSILLLAVEIVKHRRGGSAESFTWRYPVSVSVVFGLLHGFGFAVVLQELGLPGSMKVQALLFFNIGVELGQLAFIAAVLLLVFIATRLVPLIGRHQVRVGDIAVYAIGVCSAYWLIERAGAVL